MSNDPRSLSEGFPAVAYEDWQQRVAEALRGRGDEETLASRTYDGLTVRPLYRRADMPDQSDPAGFPGFAAYLRGSAAAHPTWEIRQRHAHPDPDAANRQILKDLERGVGGVTLRVDPEGRCGSVIRSKADLAAALNRVDMTLAPVSLDAGAYASGAAALLLALWDEQGLSGDGVQGHLGLDPLGALAGGGRIAGDTASALTQTGALAALLAKRYPNATAVNVTSRPYHSGGASEGQELGAMLAAGVAYLRAMEAEGLVPEAAAGQIAFTLMADADVVLTIAKIRAARALWGRMLAACGVDSPPAMHLAAETAPRMYTRTDPWTNTLRATTAAFAAAVAGADAIAADPHDAAIGPSDAFARRIARNVQIILVEESHVAQVMDPAGGAYHVERLTRDLAEAAWAEFQRIEGEGGLEKSLAGGALQQRISKVRAQRAEAAARRSEPVIGVSAYPSLEDVAAEPMAADREAILARAEARTDPAMPADASWPALIAAARAGAGIVALNAALSGETTAEALPSWRPAARFEAFRANSDTVLERTSERPRVFLATLGNEAQFSPRATWAQNFYAVGGIETVAGPGGTEADAIARAFQKNGRAEAVICGPDALYAEHLAELALALKRAGVRHLTVAGRPDTEKEQAWREAGVDDFIYEGVDMPAVLEGFYARMGEAS